MFEKDGGGVRMCRLCMMVSSQCTECHGHVRSYPCDLSGILRDGLYLCWASERARRGGNCLYSNLAPRLSRGKFAHILITFNYGFMRSCSSTTLVCVYPATFLALAEMRWIEFDLREVQFYRAYSCPVICTSHLDLARRKTVGERKKRKRFDCARTQSRESGTRACIR